VLKKTQTRHKNTSTHTLTLIMRRKKSSGIKGNTHTQAKLEEKRVEVERNATKKKAKCYAIRRNKKKRLNC
jgi:hypothetical protein